MAMYVPIIQLPAGPVPLPQVEQILGTRDCDPAIGELVLSADVAALFAPSAVDWPLDYNPTLKLSDGRVVDVRVYKAAAGGETLLGEPWREIVKELGLMPGDVVFFEKSLLENSTFSVLFQDPDGLNRLSRYELGEDADADPIEFPQVNAGAHGGVQAARAHGGERAMQGDVMTIEEAMDLAVESGAGEGSDEHYMATQLFVRARNRAMFGTFRTNAGRLQWLRRCYEDRMN